MIRILHVVTDMSRGGLETFLMNYYRFIDRNRMQFDFLTHRKKRGDYDDEIEELGGIIYRLDRLNPFSISYRAQLNDFFKDHPEYRIIHVHQDCLSSIILKAAMKQGVRVRIAHSHSSNQTINWKYPIKLFYKQFIPMYATQLAACSKAAGDWMFNGKEYILIHNAIDASRFTFNPVVRSTIRKELGISDVEIVIGHVGRFAEAKNHGFLISIFEEIQNCVAAKLLLVGDGYLRKQVEDQIHKRGLDSKVIMTGVQADVAGYLQAMDVFVFPSIYEGLPVTLIEAQASGLPCVISDKVPQECMITDLVEQMELGDKVKNWAELAIKLSKQVRNNTKTKIEHKGYDIKQNAIFLMDYYEELIV